MTPEKASNFGGWIGRNVGSRLAASRKAKRNLVLALPSYDDAKANSVIMGMWDNLGRIISEYAHLKALGQEFYTEIIGGDIIEDIQQSNKGAICFGGHLGNWEIPAAATFTQYKFQMPPVYRAPNNPDVNELLVACRTLDPSIPSFSKSSSGTRDLVKHVKNGGVAGIVFDQKYNPGVEAQFFGRPAMTSTAAIDIAQKFNIPLVPIRCERVDKCSFRVTFFDPMELFNEDGSKRDAMEVLNEMHAYLERWIEERPEQWLWLHKRWKD